MSKQNDYLEQEAQRRRLYGRETKITNKELLYAANQFAKSCFHMLLEHIEMTKGNAPIAQQLKAKLLAGEFDFQMGDILSTKYCFELQEHWLLGSDLCRHQWPAVKNQHRAENSKSISYEKMAADKSALRLVR